MNKKTKVFHLLGFRQRIGGIIPSIEGVVDAMDSNEFEQYLVVQPEYTDHRADNLTLLRYRFLNGEHPSYLVSVLGAGMFVLATGFQRRLSKGDIVHCHTRSGIIAGYLLALINRKIMIYAMPHGYMKHKWLYRMGKYFRNVHYVCLTQHLAEYYRYGELGIRHSIVSETCQSRFMDPLSERKPSLSKRICISGFGTYTPRKGWHLVVEALTGLSSDERARIEVHLYGATHLKFTEDYKAELLRKVESHGLTSCIYIHENTRDVFEQLDQSAWCLMPSSDEPCSVAIIEALSRGVPVIGTSSGGTPEVVDPPNGGLLFERENGKELSSLLRDIATGKIVPPERDQVREVGSRRWPTAVARDYTTLYLSSSRNPVSSAADVRDPATDKN